jgi:hypothetical protein
MAHTTRSRNVSFWINEKEAKRLDALAQKHNLTLSHVFRIMMRMTDEGFKYALKQEIEEEHTQLVAKSGVK